MSRTIIIPLLALAACTDDAGPGTDGASCACPPAEPPLAGRIVRVEARRTTSSQFLDAGAECPAGAMLLGGGCYVDDSTPFSAVLNDAGALVISPSIYKCYWDNQAQRELTAVAWATCLLPAP